MAEKKNISDLVFDDKNFNKGSEFGTSLMDKSLSKFGAGRSVLIDKNNRLIAGNKTTEKFGELGGQNVLIVDTDKDTLVAVRRNDIDLDTPEGREFALADNATAKANIVWDAEVMEAEISEAVCEEWGVKEFKEGEKDLDEEKLKELVEKWVPDCLFPSNNMYDIPTLLSELQADVLHNPVKPYGADSRDKKGVGTYHFYVDDYRFGGIWDNPNKVINSECLCIIEPNLSLFNTTPISYGLHLIFKKRWIARYFQSANISIFVDLNVNSKFAEYNLLGVPDGWKSFATRGYEDRLDDLQFEYEIARNKAGTEPIFVIYGGGKKVKKFSADNNCIYIEQFKNGNYFNKN